MLFAAPPLISALRLLSFWSKTRPDLFCVQRAVTALAYSDSPSRRAFLRRTLLLYVLLLASEGVHCWCCPKIARSIKPRRHSPAGHVRCITHLASPGGRIHACCCLHFGLRVQLRRIHSCLSLRTARILKQLPLRTADVQLLKPLHFMNGAPPHLGLSLPFVPLLPYRRLIVRLLASVGLLLWILVTAAQWVPRLSPRPPSLL